MSWLLLLHQIPPDPLYLRAKILRRIKQLGAISVKKSAYVLPLRDDTVEDFEWLRKEILAGGGEAWILRGEFLAGLTSEELIRQFQEERAQDYAELLAAPERSPARIRKRLKEIARIDFFEAPGKDKVMEMLKKMESPELETPAVSPFARGATWVTRQGVKVDRMSSAWLIRRYLDPLPASALSTPRTMFTRRARSASTCSKANTRIRTTAARSRCCCTPQDWKSPGCARSPKWFTTWT